MTQEDSTAAIEVYNKITAAYLLIHTDFGTKIRHCKMLVTEKL
jgi:hypothetical protein